MTKILPLLFLILVPGLSCSNGVESNSKTRPNILLIAIDDLRPELHCYGADHIISPNIDQLSSEGVLFSKAYTQQAVCAPSRNTLLTGMRPDGLGIHDLGTFFRSSAPDIQTLPQLFKENGYAAEGMGKIYHTGHGNQNDTLSWSRKFWTPAHIVHDRTPVQSGDTTNLQTCFPKIKGEKLPWLRSQKPEAWHDDAMTAAHAIERIQALKDTSFFLAVGFRKPHLPFVAPKAYWDLYDHDAIPIPPKEKPEVPTYAFLNSHELRKYHQMPDTGFFSDEDTRNLIHGYYACISFIDAQVGYLINELKRMEIFDNTIIVVWGDHGWKLGEYGEWCKHTNYEIDTRIPVIVKTPGTSTGKGRVSEDIIETVDIYPTLCELAGLKIPGHVQGTSFLKLLIDPEYHWEDVAFSQYPRTRQQDGKTQHLMGTSMRTGDYRITQWKDRETGELVDQELYRHTSAKLEKINLANDPLYADTLLALNRRFDIEYEREHR